VLTPRWQARRLTSGERSLCVEVFGQGMDLDRVRLWSCPPVGWTTNRPFVAGGLLWPGRSLIIYPPAAAHADFAAPGTPLFEQSVFIHEMTHVWQSQRGMNLLTAKLRAGDKPASYAYELTQDCAWEGFNMEQQAMIVQHAFLRRRGGRAPHPEEAYLAVLPFRPGGDDARFG
jgi:hypothetical protein